jgi:uncharacterized protein with HEPN domain
MSDKELMVISTLEDIVYSIELIESRFESIKSSDDFLADDVGIEKLDSISMRLVAIGEGFKNIDKITNKKLLINYPSVDWRGVKGVRDILSHHYFQLDAETIFEICDNHLGELLVVSKQMMSDVKKSLKDS